MCFIRFVHGDVAAIESPKTGVSSVLALRRGSFSRATQQSALWIAALG